MHNKLFPNLFKKIKSIILDKNINLSQIFIPKPIDSFLFLLISLFNTAKKNPIVSKYFNSTIDMFSFFLNDKKNRLLYLFMWPIDLSKSEYKN